MHPLGPPSRKGERAQAEAGGEASGLSADCRPIAGQHLRRVCRVVHVVNAPPSGAASAPSTKPSEVQSDSSVETSHPPMSWLNEAAAR